MKIDPRSADIALYYTGSDAGEPAIVNVPARDLTEGDLARLVGDISGAAFSSATDKLIDQLTAGPYRKTEPTPAGPAKKPEE